MKPFYRSKKFWAMALGVVGSITAGAMAFVSPDVAAVLAIVSLASYKISQGLSDLGKERAAIEAE